MKFKFMNTKHFANAAFDDHLDHQAKQLDLTISHVSFGLSDNKNEKFVGIALSTDETLTAKYVLNAVHLAANLARSDQATLHITSPKAAMIFDYQRVNEMITASSHEQKQQFNKLILETIQPTL